MIRIVGFPFGFLVAGLCAGLALGFVYVDLMLARPFGYYWFSRDELIDSTIAGLIIGGTIGFLAGLACDLSIRDAKNRQRILEVVWCIIIVGVIVYFFFQGNDVRVRE